MDGVKFQDQQCGFAAGIEIPPNRSLLCTCDVIIEFDYALADVCAVGEAAYQGQILVRDTVDELVVCHRALECRGDFLGIKITSK